MRAGTGELVVEGSAQRVNRVVGSPQRVEVAEQPQAVEQVTPRQMPSLIVSGMPGRQLVRR